MISAWGVDHGVVSKMVIKAPPKSKVKRGKIKAINATHKVINYGAGPTPAMVALKSVTPIRSLLSH